MADWKILPILCVWICIGKTNPLWFWHRSPLSSGLCFVIRSEHCRREESQQSIFACDRMRAIIKDGLLMSFSFSDILLLLWLCWWISLFRALFPTWRRSVLTQWSQSHPLFQLNGKNRLPVSWRWPPPTLTCTHSSMRSPLLTHLTPTPPSHFCLPHLSLSPSSSFTLSPPFPPSLSLPHPSLTAFCSSSGVTSCRKSHGSWLEKSDLRQSQDGSQTARAFLITVTQQHDWLGFISLHWKPVPLFLFLFSSSLLPFSSSPSSPHPSESLRSCLLDQNGCVCRGREKEGMRGRQRCWGVREMEGGAEWRRAVVMSHLLQADRMAEESCHVPHSREEAEDGENTKRVGRKMFFCFFSLSKHTFICEGCASRSL